MKTYEIKEENGKQVIYYYEGELLETKEAYYGEARDGYKDKNAPNYYGLEQALFKSSIFTKYIMDYNANGLLFTQVINNGKRGEDVNEQTLLAGFQVMQIAFTQVEKDQINAVLTSNGFSIQLK